MDITISMFLIFFIFTDLRLSLKLQNLPYHLFKVKFADIKFHSSFVQFLKKTFEFSLQVIRDII